MAAGLSAMMAFATSSATNAQPQRDQDARKTTDKTSGTRETRSKTRETQSKTTEIGTRRPASRRKRSAGTHRRSKR